MPNWFRKKNSKTAPGSRLALSFTPWITAAIAFFYGSLFLATLNDWNGFLGEEGTFTYGAQRWLSGEWPYRNFFYLWPPLVLAFHAAAEFLGASDAGLRALSLAAGAGSVGLLLQESRHWLTNWKERLILVALLLLWSFPLWNVPHVFWFALFFSLLGLRLRERSWWLAGGAVAFAFWCKQNTAIGAALGILIVLLSRRQYPAAGKFFGSFLALVLIPAAALFFAQGSTVAIPAFRQIFFGADQGFSLSEGSLPSWVMGGPLITLGLWLCSMYLVRASAGTVRWARAAAVMHASYSIGTEGREYFTGLFGVLTYAAWIGSFLFLLQERPKKRRTLLFTWLPGLGIFLTIFPRADLPHFLFVWPLSAALLVWCLGRIPRRYPLVKKSWAFFPLWLLLIGGGVFEGRALFVRYFGEWDAAGFRSYGVAHQLSSEMNLVVEYLKTQGMGVGDPIFVAGNAASFYRFSGFRNVLPVQQILPGYLSAVGLEESEVLPRFEKAGGRFVVEPRDSNLLKSAPVLSLILREEYEEVRRFPLYFSVWRKRGT